MKYAMLIHERPGYVRGAGRARAKGRVRRVHGAGGGSALPGRRAAPADRDRPTVRVQDGQTLTTDGPYADTKEVFGGYYVFEADNLDEAIELAARIPAARLGGAIEVRPLVGR
jgi:hypothetical protein